VPIFRGLPLKAGAVVEEPPVGWPEDAPLDAAVDAAADAAVDVGAELAGEAEVVPAEAEVVPAEGVVEPEEQAARTAAVRTARTLTSRRSAIPASDVSASR
jgi:hypothetical protein